MMITYGDDDDYIIMMITYDDYIWCTNVNHHTLIWAYYIYSDQSDYRAARARPASDDDSFSMHGTSIYPTSGSSARSIYTPLYPTGKGSVEMDHNIDFTSAGY